MAVSSGNREADPQNRWAGFGALELPRDLATHEGLDALQLVGQLGTGQLSVMGGLGAQPVTGAEPQRAAEPQVGVGGDRSLAGDDLADAGGGHADRFGQAVLADAQRFEEHLITAWVAFCGLYLVTATNKTIGFGRKSKAREFLSDFYIPNALSCGSC